MELNDFLALLFCLGSIFLVVKKYKVHADILKYGELKTGTIVKYEWSGTFPRKYRLPLIQFTINEKTVELLLPANFLNPPNDIGDQVSIVFWNNKPDKIILPDKDYWIDELYIIFLIILFSFIGRYFLFSK